MLIDSLLIFVVMRRLWHWNRVRSRSRSSCRCSLIDLDVPRVELAQDSRRRLVPARRSAASCSRCSRRGSAAARCCMDALAEETMPLDALHREHRGEPADARAGHRGVPDRDAGSRAARAAAQPQAQQGAARARRVPDDRRRATFRACRPTERVRRSTTSAATSGRSTRTSASRRIPTCRSCSRSAARRGFAFDMMETSFFVSRETLIATVAPGMALWRERLFVSMSKNATKATEFFHVPDQPRRRARHAGRAVAAIRRTPAAEAGVVAGAGVVLRSTVSCSVRHLRRASSSAPCSRSGGSARRRRRTRRPGPAASPDRPRAASAPR